MRRQRARRTQDNAKVPVEILDMRIAGNREVILSKAQHVDQRRIVKSFRSAKVGDREVDVIDSQNFGHYAHPRKATPL